MQYSLSCSPYPAADKAAITSGRLCTVLLDGMRKELE
jgi:hypothetical protein